MLTPKSNLEKPMSSDVFSMFDLSGRVAVVIGGAGVLCSAISKQLAKLGARIVVLDVNVEKANNLAEDIRKTGGKAIGIRNDVLDKASLKEAREIVIKTFGRVDLLINGAGGNHPAATTSDETKFYDLDAGAIQKVFDLNFTGTFFTSQVFGEQMVSQGEGIILNIVSMNAIRPLTRIPAYSAAKAAVANFTQWLAVHMAQNYSPKIRVNAIAPGFFLTEQNHYLMIDKGSGNLTARAQTILAHTPEGRFGSPEDLLGTVVWLLSPASAFVTGVIIPVDGGFSAFSGV
jgi:NAD(P)-dependent dehydrogenase (short-subunit alcohol dehydrogenase family)